MFILHFVRGKQVIDHRRKKSKAEIDRCYYQTERGKATRDRARKKYEQTISGWANKQVRRIRYRCNVERAKMFYRYGARGIKLKFTGKELAIWIETNGFEYLGRQIHRINNDGDYSLDNIVLLTPKNHRAIHWDGVPI